MKKPEQLEAIDLTKLREICQEYIDFLDDEEEYYEDNDFDHYIFEAAIEVVFGEDVWDFINSKMS